MATKFLRDANNFQLVNSSAINVYDELPGGNYVIRKSQEGVMFLQMADPFKHPKKMYGNIMERANRIRQTFEKRNSATGVLFSGEKGSGKTLLCRTVCIEAAKEGIPTIIINEAWSGTAFFSFLAAITQPCIVLFDEFEKVYDTKKNEQDAILTLLDGVFPSRKLFLLTCNDRYGISNNMINRPGRIFYSLEFSGLDENFIREYAADTLKNKDHVESVVRVTHLFSQFNFDMLQALIEEMNRYGETPADALTMLNVSPVYDFASYKINVQLGNGRIVENERNAPSDMRNPMAQKAGIHIRVSSKKVESTKPTLVPVAANEANEIDKLLAFHDDDDDDGHPGFDHFHCTFYPADVINVTADSIVMKNKRGDILNLTKEKHPNYNWGAMDGVL